MQDVIVKSAGQPYRTEIIMDEHQWFADEPKMAGGANTAPPPTALLLSSLGACTAITVRMYARRKGIALEGVTVTLRHSTEIDASITVTHIVCELALEGNLSHEERLRLMEIAEACPVHKLLTGPIEIRNVMIGK